MKTTTRTTTEERYETPFGVGRLLLAGDLPLDHEIPDQRLSPSGAAPGPWGRLLQWYFAGDPVTFPLDLDAYVAAVGATAFEAAALRALHRVPYGEVLSYRDLAVAAGRPNAYRAVGTVMAGNRLPVILPCHRVIHNDGSLGQYGDDPAWKRRLLELEGVDLAGRRAS